MCIAAMEVLVAKNEFVKKGDSHLLNGSWEDSRGMDLESQGMTRTVTYFYVRRKESIRRPSSENAWR